MVVLLETGVRNHEFAVVQNEVRDEPVTEVDDAVPELRRLGGHLLEGLGESVTGRDLLTAQGLDEFVLVVTRNRYRMSRRDHPHDQTQHTDRIRSSIHVVTEEDGSSPFRRHRIGSSAVRPVVDGVAEFHEERLELTSTSVDVTDDVERTTLDTQIAAERVAQECGFGNRVLTSEDVNRTETFLTQPAERASQLLVLTANHVASERPIRASVVSCRTDRFRNIEHDCHRQYVVLASQRNESLARGGLDVGRVDHRETSASQTLGRNELQHFESIGRRLL